MCIRDSKRGMDKAVEALNDRLLANARELAGTEEIGQVAALSLSLIHI